MTDDDPLLRSRDPDPRVRRRALHDLCPCAQKRASDPVWERILEMAGDPDASVRRLALHALCDGSPRAREPEIVAAVEALARDPERTVHRLARKVLAHHRRTGRINVL